MDLIELTDYQIITLNKILYMNPRNTEYIAHTPQGKILFRRRDIDE